MKKFAKIMALALALCMVMSVAAFASTANRTETDRVVSVTVTGAGNGEQVALLILKHEATVGGDDEAIVYVGQMVADEDGEAAFGNITIPAGTFEAVDVYAGNATYATAHGTYETVGTVELTNETTDVVVKLLGDVTIVPSVKSEAEDGNLYGSAVSAEFDFTLPTKQGVALESAHMIWSLKADGSTGDKVRYTKPIPLATAGLEGAVRLSAVFVSGTLDETDDEPVEVITGAAAIFKFKRTGIVDDQEVFFDDADKLNRAPAQEEPEV